MYFAHGENCFEIDEKLDFPSNQINDLMSGEYRGRLVSNAAHLLKSSFSASFQASRIIEKL